METNDLDVIVGLKIYYMKYAQRLNLYVNIYRYKYSFFGRRHVSCSVPKQAVDTCQSVMPRAKENDILNNTDTYSFFFSILGGSLFPFPQFWCLQRYNIARAASSLYREASI